MIHLEIARERLTPTTSTGFTSTNILPSNPRTIYVCIQSIGGDIFFRTDGEDATILTGNKLPENSRVEIHGGTAITNFRCIDCGDAAEVECKYMGQSGG